MAAAAFFHLLLPLAFFSVLLCSPIAPASACGNLPKLTVEDACVKATSTHLMYELCKDALHDNVYITNGADVYALMAARRALASYADTVRAAGALRGDGSLPGGDRDAYAACEDAYRAAADAMDRAVAAVTACRFSDGGGADLGQVYRDGIAQVDACKDRVMVLPSSPLFVRSLVDRNWTVLAYFLARLLGVQ